MLEGSKSLHVSVLGKETQTSKKADRCLNSLACMLSLASADLFAPLLSCSLEISWSRVIKEIIINDNNINHNYIKILESDWSTTALISAVIGQLHTSRACNWTVVRVMPE